jgi:hypothetical protein
MLVATGETLQNFRLTELIFEFWSYRGDGQSDSYC